MVHRLSWSPTSGYATVDDWREETTHPRGIRRTQPTAHTQMRTMVLEYLPSGKLTVCYGSHGPFIADGPIENCDFL